MGVFFVLKIQVSSSQEEKPWLDLLISKFIVATLGLSVLNNILKKMYHIFKEF
jgi:hypothetical protein